MPAGLYIFNHEIVFLDPEQTRTFSDVNGFVGVRDSYSFAGIDLYWVSHNRVDRLTSRSPYYEITVSNKILTLKNSSSNRRGYTLFYQNINIIV